MKLVVAVLPDSKAGQLRDVADALTMKKEGVAVVLAARAGKGAQLLVALSRDLVARGLNAVDIARGAAPEIGGGGGGRPDQAQAGGQHADGIAAALERAEALIAERIA